jgi:hypothetical protein
MSGLASQQDGGQFEDALRRLHALEIKLTDQVGCRGLVLPTRQEPPIVCSAVQIVCSAGPGRQDSTPAQLATLAFASGQAE